MMQTLFWFFLGLWFYRRLCAWLAHQKSAPVQRDASPDPAEMMVECAKCGAYYPPKTKHKCG